MSALRSADVLIRAGRFADALKLLGTLAVHGEDRIAADVLRAHLLERTGQYSQASMLCERLLVQQRLTKVQKSVCEATLGIIKHDTIDPAGGIRHFQRAVDLARSSKDLVQIAWSQLRLMLALANLSGPQSAVPSLLDIRATATKLGDTQVSAALHIFVAEMEAKRGLVQSAERHAQMGARLLGREPNLWLDARAEIALVAVAIMRSDVQDGMSHAFRALRLAEQCGAAGVRRACLANLGNLLYLTGEFEAAVEHFRAADAALPEAGELSSGALESLARLSLLQGRLEEAAAYLERIRQSVVTPSDWLLYVNRHSQLTEAELLNRSGLFEKALENARVAHGLARRAGDDLLETRSQLVKADILRCAGRFSESALVLAEIEGVLHKSPPEIFAHYECVLGCALITLGDRLSSSLHLERAKRIFRGLQNAPGLIAVEHARTEAGRSGHAKPILSKNVQAHDEPSTRCIVQDIAAFMMHAGRPELLATGLAAILSESGAVVTVFARSRADDGSVETLASSGEPRSARRSDAAAERTIAVGSVRDRAFEVVLTPRQDIDSLATVNAVLLLLDHVRDLERAHVEREERLTLWPAEEVPAEDDQAVVGGDMLKLMAEARKIAATNASVLITGESGTGKEIMARAIHRHSSRADKPFVPFNSAAIPREMLESQLFGYRRGAFTGADRDSLGLIRAAKDGTLFLDEIGEMSLDLQPKLLRFLESGEINPLGEPSPFNVDVRIIAATNSNLEQLVEEGRFREDLFYRLNVFRIPIPPLRERRDEIPALVHQFVARAATEFRKGRLRVAEETMEHLVLCPWPGNVRQLQNELRRMVALADDDSVLTPASLSAQILQAAPKTPPRAPGPPDPGVPLPGKLMPTLARIEREMITAALSSHQGRIEAAAKSLGISRKGLYLKRQRLGL